MDDTDREPLTQRKQMNTLKQIAQTVLNSVELSILYSIVLLCLVYVIYMIIDVWIAYKRLPKPNTQCSCCCNRRCNDEYKTVGTLIDERV